MHTHTINTLPERRLRCILFDLGDTLWTVGEQATWDRFTAEGEQQALTLLQQHIDASTHTILDQPQFGARFYQLLRHQLNALTRLKPDYEPDFALAVNQALTQVGLPEVDHALACAIFESFNIPIHPTRRLFDDTLTTLEALRTRGFLLGVVSNRHWGGTLFMESVKPTGLLKYFRPEEMAISADLGICKPNPAIFLHALNALDVAPTEAAMVGDSLRADIAGAAQLGIYTIWKPSPRVRAEAQIQFMADRPLDDETLLAYANQRYPQPHTTIAPDIIIEQLSDLLPLLHKAGLQ